MSFRLTTRWPISLITTLQEIDFYAHQSRWGTYEDEVFVWNRTRIPFGKVLRRSILTGQRLAKCCLASCR